MNYDGCARKLQGSNLRHYCAIFLEEIRKITNNLRIAGVPVKI
jgi:hypothetical protein